LGESQKKFASLISQRYTSSRAVATSGRSFRLAECCPSTSGGVFVMRFLSKNARPLVAAFFTATLIFNIVGVARANGSQIYIDCYLQYCGTAGTPQLISACTLTGCADAHTVNGVLDYPSYLACINNALARAKKGPIPVCPNSE
jgi:hypothetical protein